MTDRPLYRYAARFVRAVDGDTVELVLQLGFNIELTDHVRLFGVNTPELHGPDAAKAREAKQFVEAWFTGTGPLYIQSDRFNSREKYGRILATIFRGTDPVSLNERLVIVGLATPMQD